MKNLNKMTTILFLMLFLFMFSACQMGSDLEDLLEEKIAADELLIDENNPSLNDLPAAYSGVINLEASKAGAGEVTLVWENPADADYDHIVLSYEPGGTGEIQVDKETNSYIYSGLITDEYYTFSAHTVSIDGDAGPSDSIGILMNSISVDIVCISSAEELKALSNDVATVGDGYFIQTENIDLSDYSSGSGWVPIGTLSNPFTGWYNGNDHSITNLVINTPSIYLGLFGVIHGTLTGDKQRAIVGRINLENVQINGSDTVGSLAGRISNSAYITECSATGTVSASSSYPAGGLIGTISGISAEPAVVVDCNSNISVSGGSTGGIVGYATYCVLDNTNSRGIVSGASTAGGLVGTIGNSQISYCYSSASVTSNPDFGVGGLIGRGSEIAVDNCYARGAVNCNTYAGGFIGYAYGGSAGSFINCYSTGPLSSTSSYTGGFFGRDDAASVSNCFYDYETTGHPTGSKVSATSTILMKTESTFTNNAWDFIGETVNGTEDIWSIDTSGVINDGYPYLQ